MLNSHGTLTTGRMTLLQWLIPWLHWTHLIWCQIMLQRSSLHVFSLNWRRINTRTKTHMYVHDCIKNHVHHVHQNHSLHRLYFGLHFSFLVAIHIFSFALLSLSLCLYVFLSLVITVNGQKFQGWEFSLLLFYWSDKLAYVMLYKWKTELQTKTEKGKPKYRQDKLWF